MAPETVEQIPDEKLAEMLAAYESGPEHGGVTLFGNVELASALRELVSCRSSRGKGEALDRDELLGITEYLLGQADLDTPADDEPGCDDLCGARVCHEVGCVVSKYRRARTAPQPGHKP